MNTCKLEKETLLQGWRPPRVFSDWREVEPHPPWSLRASKTHKEVLALGTVDPSRPSRPLVIFAKLWLLL